MKRMAVCISLAAAASATLPAAHAAPRLLAQAAPPPKSLAESLAPDARAEFEGGKLLFSDGDMAGALVKFQRAYEKSKDARVLWNIAVCEKRLRHYAKVIEYLERFRVEGAAVLEGDELKEAAELIAELRPFTGTIRLKVNQPLAAVTIDGEPAGSTPLERPLVVDIGQRQLKVTREGFQPFARQVLVAGPEEQTIEVQLVAEPHEGRLMVVTDEDASIYVDEVLMGNERWEGRVNSGRHTVRIRSATGKEERREVMVQDGDARIVQFGVNGRTEKGGGGLGAGAWAAILGGGAALVAGGVITGVMLGNRTRDPLQGTMNPGVVQLP